jgi:hypothetical protein
MLLDASCVRSMINFHLFVVSGRSWLFRYYSINQSGVLTYRGFRKSLRPPSVRSASTRIYAQIPIGDYLWPDYAVRLCQTNGRELIKTIMSNWILETKQNRKPPLPLRDLQERTMTTSLPWKLKRVLRLVVFDERKKEMTEPSRWVLCCFSVTCFVCVLSYCV